MNIQIPEFEEKPIPKYQKYGALALFVLVVLLIVLGWHRFLADFWPLDASRVGPNLVASVVQWALVLIAAVLLWPPTRRRIHRFIDRKMQPIHDHLQHAANERNELHRKLDHIIHHHPDIPDYQKDLNR